LISPQSGYISEPLFTTETHMWHKPHFYLQMPSPGLTPTTITTTSICTSLALPVREYGWRIFRVLFRLPLGWVILFLNKLYISDVVCAPPQWPCHCRDNARM
jgi:hypothetical protein